MKETVTSRRRAKATLLQLSVLVLVSAQGSYEVNWGHRRTMKKKKLGKPDDNIDLKKRKTKGTRSDNNVASKAKGGRERMLMRMSGDTFWLIEDSKYLLIIIIFVYRA
eukprot:TRINITY_DN431_c2_g1_i1.p1 TRINITY_DN431_c2_g1~~TRINITY_DN431_c2_g1_i1.p1  ORF type:complete len:108 (-),score=11.69 TRINITY_DN431_c2_g1_i1:362-685(-)